MQNNELAEELHKPIVGELKMKSIHIFYRQYLVCYMQLLSKFNGEFRYLLCIIDIYNKSAWVIPLKDKKGITITNTFQKI